MYNKHRLCHRVPNGDDNLYIVQVNGKKLTDTTKQRDQEGDHTGTNHHVREETKRLSIESAILGNVIEDGGEIVVYFDVDTNANQGNANDHEEDV